MPYRVKKGFLQYRQLRTVVNGKIVALVEAHTREKKGTQSKAPSSVQIPLATQGELKAAFERGDPCVEWYEEKEKTPFFEHETENPFKGVEDSVLEEHGIKAKDTKQKMKAKEHEP